MTILSDVTLLRLAAVKTDPLVSGIESTDHGTKTSRVQPSSIDLTIGVIYQPGSETFVAGQAKADDRYVVPAYSELILEPGQTAVVETAQTLKLPPNIAAIGFPPSAVSSNALLMTNPGHIDPGYHGTMKFTVINFGKTPYTLKVNDPICTTLFLQLDTAAAQPYASLANPPGVQKPSNEPMDPTVRLLRRLSRDFVDIDTRINKGADESIRRAGLKLEASKIFWPTIAGIVTAGLSAAAILVSSNVFTPYRDVDRRVASLEGKVDATALQKALDDLNKRVEGVAQMGFRPSAADLKDLSARIESLERKAAPK